MAKPSDQEILARIDNEVTSALGYGDELSEQRRKALEYYLGQPFGNEVEGRSQVVDSTVMDTIEWIKPSLMRVFASGDEIAKVHAQGPEDVPYAEQAQDYINWVLSRQTDFFHVANTWFTDALLAKVGVVKVWWDDSDQWDRETYTGLSDTELESLLMSDNVEVLEHSQESTEDIIPVVTHDVVITRHTQKGRVRIENVPPEEFLISKDAKSVEDARFVCHRVKKTVTELREMGFEIDPDEIGKGDDFYTWSNEKSARHAFDRTGIWEDQNVDAEDALKEGWVYESYLRTDYDGDGIAELRRILTVGNQILENEPVDRRPFCTLCPIPIPHKFYGMSVADQVMVIQEVKSILLRNLLDNMYLQNSGRVAVQEGMVALDDLLTSRPGGIVRTKAPGAVQPLPTPPLEPYTFQMLGYMDSIREERSGMTKMSQGLDSNALTSHTSATQVAQVMTAAQQRVEMIARIFAETGVRDLVKQVFELAQKNEEKEKYIKLRGEWVEVRPDQWRDYMDCTVEVGLGHGNRDQQLLHISTMLNFASQAMSGGLSIVTEENLYNLGAKMIENMGFKDVQNYITKPQEQQGPSQEEQMAQMEMMNKQKELEIKAAEVQIKAQKMQQEAAEAQVDAQLKAQELALEAQQNRPVAVG